MLKVFALFLALALGLCAILGNQLLCSAESARVRLAESQIGSLAAEVSTYHLRHGYLPYSLQQLVGAGLIRDSQIIDPWGTPIGYFVTPNGQSFLLSSSGSPARRSFRASGSEAPELEIQAHGS